MITKIIIYIFLSGAMQYIGLLLFFEQDYMEQLLLFSKVVDLFSLLIRLYCVLWPWLVGVLFMHLLVEELIKLKEAQKKS